MIPSDKQAPYILVDDQKIFPIQRAGRPDRAARDRSGGDALPFGVVDRVTLSAAGRAKCKQANP